MELLKHLNICQDIKNLIETELYRSNFNDVLKEMSKIKHNYDFHDYTNCHSFKKNIKINDIYYKIESSYIDGRYECGQSEVNFEYRIYNKDFDLSIESSSDCLINDKDYPFFEFLIRKYTLFMRGSGLLLYVGSERKNEVYQTMRGYVKNRINFRSVIKQINMKNNNSK